MPTKHSSPEHNTEHSNLEHEIEQRRSGLEGREQAPDHWHKGVRILRRPEVQRRTGLSRSTIYGLMAEGLFPRPIRLGKRAVGWPDHVIDDFLQSRSQTGEG